MVSPREDESSKTQSGPIVTHTPNCRRTNRYFGGTFRCRCRPPAKPYTNEEIRFLVKRFEDQLPGWRRSGFGYEGEDARVLMSLMELEQRRDDDE